MVEGNEADLMRGADSIAAFLRGLLGDPKVTGKTVYYWHRCRKIPAGKVGADIIASKSVLREHYTRAARGE
jgi:hypothetical protein